jgi:hypothetical protein
VCGVWLWAFGFGERERVKFNYIQGIRVTCIAEPGVDVCLASVTERTAL